jgi:hypothetical protein
LVRYEDMTCHQLLDALEDAVAEVTLYREAKAAKERIALIRAEILRRM